MAFRLSPCRSLLMPECRPARQRARLAFPAKLVMCAHPFRTSEGQESRRGPAIPQISQRSALHC
jgi:hypothetical protein